MGAIFDQLLPDRGERGPPISDKRRTVNGILWVLRTGAPCARHARTIRQLESRCSCASPAGASLGWWDAALATLATLGPPADEGACHQFHDRAGAPTCGRRKRGNQDQEALGRLRRGFSTKIHLRTNAKGDPLTFDVTGWARAHRGQRL